MNKDIVVSKIKQLTNELIAGFEVSNDNYRICKMIYQQQEYPDWMIELFSVLHSKINSLFEFMNFKAQPNRNRHYNADESRQLIKVIKTIDDCKHYFEKIGYSFIIDNKYYSFLNYIKPFLSESWGSEIPIDYKPIRIEDIDPVFTSNATGNFVKLNNEKKITKEFARNQLKKIDSRINEEDYEGAITSSRSLLEDVFKQIFFEITEKDLDKKGNLNAMYKEIAGQLNLEAKNHQYDFLKKICSGLNSVIDGIAPMRNEMSDSHSQSIKPQRHHAVLAKNCTLTITEFLFDTVNYQLKEGKLNKNNRQ